MIIRRPGQPPTQPEVNLYLDELRKSSIANMYGAAPHVANAFGIDRPAAQRMLAEWMRTFTERHTTTGGKP